MPEFGQESCSLLLTLFLPSLKEHKVKPKRLGSSSTVKQLRDDLKKIYFPHHTNPSNMPQIYIALNSTWDEANIKQLYLLYRPSFTTAVIYCTEGQKLSGKIQDHY